MDGTRTNNGLGDLIARSDIQNRFPFLSKKALAELASKGDGPPYIKAMGQAYYRPADIEEWLMSKMVMPGQKSSDTVTDLKAKIESPPVKRGRGRPRKGDTRSRKTA
ncbi:MAG: hypothetical protein HQL42_10850 [Alphaproteobacteria bacterium]|nr:hypothetical protein [Alphaproteobacteria bacterium]